MMAVSPAVVVRSATKTFKQRGRRGRTVVALDDVTLSIGSGQALGVVGESGSGKSTLARCILGLVAPDTGRIEVLGRRVTGARPGKLRAWRRDIQIVFQEPYDSLSPRLTREALKQRVLDSVGCAIGALPARPVRALRAHVEDLGGRPLSTLIGGGRTSPDRAALYNGAAVRYLDYNDCFLGKGEACHPSDNLAPVMAAAEYAGRTGRDLITALGIAYQVQCRLSEEAPVRARGFDHTTQGSFAVAAGAAKALGLDAGRTAHAIAISGTALNALRVTRTGALSNWKGLAYAHTAFGGTHAALLAARGITGPAEVFEGSKGFMHTISGDFDVPWADEAVDRVHATIIKKYNAEGHAQSVVEAVLELREEHSISISQLDHIEVDVFDAAYEIIAAGAGDKTRVSTKEEADHSLVYLVAVAFIDGEVTPAQFAPGRISRGDVQDLLRRVTVREDDELSARFPAELPCRVRLHLHDGTVFERSKTDYTGSHTGPESWGMLEEKFVNLTAGRIDSALQTEIVSATKHLDDIEVSDLTLLLASVPLPEG